MKPKKVVKRLKKAQLLLSALSEQYADTKSEIHDLLAAAGDSINRAQALIGANETLASTQKAAERPQKDRVSARGPRNGHFTDERRKKLSLAAKRRWAAAKRRGAKTLARQG